MSEDVKICGDDGVGRTLEEWNDFVSRRIFEDDSATRLSELKNSYSMMIQMAEEKKERGEPVGDMIKGFIKEKVSEYVVECVERGCDLESEMINLARAPNRKGRGSGIFFEMGYCLRSYIDEMGDVPRSRKALKRFFADRRIDVDVDLFRIEAWDSKRMSRALEHFKLRTVCRDNQEG